MAEPEAAEDLFGRQLEESLRENRALLQSLKVDLGQRTVRAQEGGDKDDMPTAFELAAMKKLEGQVRSDEMFLQARAMTRRRRPAGTPAAPVE